MGAIAVVGAGIVGVQIARELQLRAENVTLYDFQEPGQGTSFGNAGYIATDEILPLAHSAVLRSLPSMLLDPLGPISVNWNSLWSLAPWFAKYLKSCTGQNSERGIEALADLQNKAKGAWLNVVGREKIANLMRNNGSLKIFETNSGFERTVNERIRQNEYGIHWQVSNGEEARERVPELAMGVKHAVYYPDGMNTVSPIEVTEEIFRNFLKDGGSFIKAKVESIETIDRPVLISKQKKWIYDKVVVCGGYLSGLLLEPLGMKVPLIAERGYHLELDHEGLSFDMPIGSYERGCYLTPMRSGLRVAGTSEIAPIKDEPEPKWLRAEILGNHARELLPNVALIESRRWMGRRPTLPDFLPMLGSVPGWPNIFTACGHHHLGLTLSAITASMLGDYIMGGELAVIPQRLAAGRFG